MNMQSPLEDDPLTPPPWLAESLHQEWRNRAKQLQRQGRAVAPVADLLARYVTLHRELKRARARGELPNDAEKLEASMLGTGLGLFGTDES